MSTHEGSRQPGGADRSPESGEDAEFQDATAPGASVARVAVRLPPFWAEEPDVWFAQAEAQFQLAGVKEDTTKFNHIIATLDPRYVREIKDLIKNPPKTEKYAKLKHELTRRLSVSREHQIRQLLSHEELGDRKPSQFMRHLRTLADGGVSDEFLYSMWASRLPSHVQAIIVSQTSTNLDDVADLADKICEVTLPPPPHQPQVASTSTNNYDGLLKKIDDLITTRIQTELTQQIAKLSYRESRGRQPFRRNKFSRSRSRGRSQTPGMCWYHTNFREKANKCTPPCNFKQENSRGGQ